MAAKPGNTPAKIKAAKRKFLKAFREHRTVTHAAEAIGYHRVTINTWRREDPEFDKACDDAYEQVTDDLLQSSVSIAIEGYDEPVFKNGRLAGTVKRICPTLQIFHLKTRRPEEFNERLQLARKLAEALNDPDTDVRELRILFDAIEDKTPGLRPEPRNGTNGSAAS